MPQTPPISTEAERPAAPLIVDPRSSLARESRVLVDARFLGALHVELGGRLGRDGAATTLLQVGFLHGLRDSTRLLHRGMHGDHCAGGPASPQLAICVAPASGRADGVLDLRGSWPQRHEAVARVARLGVGPGTTCHLSAGYTSGWLSGILERDVMAIEASCVASGDESCRFVAREVADWLRDGDVEARLRAAALPFSRLREIVGRELAESRAAEPADQFDPHAPVVHVWGPVMVVPYAGTEECEQSLALIGRDADARDVSVVVLDLTGAVLEGTLMQVALERALQAIVGWGAEPILTGVSPRWQGVITDLESRHVALHRELPEAIALAFRIAAAQRNAA